MPNQSNDPRNQNFEASTNTRPATDDEIAYRNGYVRGKSAEQLEQERRRAAEARVYEENARLRADNGASAGLILGWAFAAAAALVGGLVYIYSTDATSGVANPTLEAPSPEPASSETTIIERTVDRPQEVVPAPSSVQPPEIDVELGNPVEQPAESAPAESAQPEASSSEAP